MNAKIFVISLYLCVVTLSGCATSDPFYTPQGNTYAKAKKVDLGNTAEGAETTATAFGLGARVPQEKSMQVSWDLTLYPAVGAQREPKREPCEVLIKSAGASNYVPYKCDRVEKVNRDYMVYYYFQDTLIAINLQTMPGNFVQNGFCESGRTYPAQLLKVRVVWSSHETVRPSSWLERYFDAVSCKPN